MSGKIAFAVVAGLVVGALATNFDRLPIGGSETTYHWPVDNTWTKSPHIVEQQQLETAVLAFADAIKQAIPPRNEALEDHRKLAESCKVFPKPDSYAMNFAYMYDSAAGVARCLRTAENIAVAHKVSYDTKFAETTAATLSREFYGTPARP